MGKISGFPVIIIAILFASSCTSTPFFTVQSSITKTVMGQTVHAPYPNVATYYGYIPSGVKPDGKYYGKKAWYIYFWAPGIIDEVGISLYSPAASKPCPKDFKSPHFKKLYRKRPQKYFDTYLILEKMNCIYSTQIRKGCKPISRLAVNNDTSEIPTNPGGRQSNSLLRYRFRPKYWKKNPVQGVYRITITSPKGIPEGSYCIQVGTNLPGVRIAASLRKLYKLARAR